MTPNYGIKISRPGFDVKTATPQQLSFNSENKTFKLHDRGSGSLNSSSTPLATIPHGLGYIPAFLVHVDIGPTGSFCIAPYGESGSPLVYAYADDTNLYIKADANVETSTYFLSSSVDQSMAREYNGFAYFPGGWGIGYFTYPLYGAVRFLNIDLDNSESFLSATLNLYISGRDGSGEVKMTVWGIDEDNTAAFDSGTAATARTKTSASDNYAATLMQGNSWGVDVTDQVTEIITRAGWVNGNALGIMFWDNGTVDGNDYLQINGDYSVTNLEITKSTPTIANYKYTIFKNQLE